MKAILRKFSSARALLLLWNTVTFALVLVSLGIVFRVLAERSLLTALDREMHLQAGRFRDTQRIEMVVLRDKLPGSGLNVRLMADRPGSIHIAAARLSAHYRNVHDMAARMPDRSGQFMYRTFDINGKPISPFESGTTPSDPLAVHLEDMGDQYRPQDHRPWDSAGIAVAASGKERYADVTENGTRLRVLSVPMRQQDKIAGVVQIAAPLGQLTRDIAGLTRTLLLVLPAALLIAIVAGLFLTDRALRPVMQMTRAAAQIRPDQLSSRLPVSGDDEFGVLASTVNGALQRVETAFTEREQAISQLRRFTADASHELRTPLTTIKANTGIALSEVVPSPEHIHALRQIDRAADRMTALVHDLLLLARSDSGQLSLDLTPVALGMIVQDAIDSLPNSHHAPIHCPSNGPDAVVLGDYEHLRRLFLNLLQNSIKYTPIEGRIEVRIEVRQAGMHAGAVPDDVAIGQVVVSGSENGDDAASRSVAQICTDDARQDEAAVAVVEITDTGCGIAPENLPFLGQPFFRVDTARNRNAGGAGLGLAICRSIAGAHKASLEIASNLAAGTRVTLTVPLHVQDFVRIGRHNRV